MNKKLISLFAALLTAGFVYGQSPIVSVKSIDRIGTPDAVDAGYFRIYNTGGTDEVSHVTIVSDSTNLFTVSPATGIISNDLQLVTITFATGLAAGNYSGNILVTQTNAPVTVRTIPVKLRITKDVSRYIGSLADARIVPVSVSSGTALPVPRYYGDMIIGSLHASTSAVWIAYGTTTNDWVLIKETVIP